MNVDIKELRKNSKSTFGWKSSMNMGKGNLNMKGCKACNTLIVSQEVEVGAMGVKALTTCVNSPTHPMVKLCMNQQVWKKMCARFKEGMVATRAQSISNALRICCARNSSPPRKRNCQCIIVFWCPINPPPRGRGRHNCGNKRNKCQVTMSNGSW